MKANSLISILACVILSSVSVYGQNSVSRMERWEGDGQLTLEKCITHVLTNNFDVSLASLTQTATENAATKGNSGLLPTISANGGANYSNNNTKLEFAGGIPPTNVDGAQSTSYNGSIALNYTVFNGFANIRTFEKLKYAQDLSEAQLRLTIENAVIATIGVYLDLAKIQADITALEETVEISQTRLKGAELAKSYGSGSTLQVYTAKVDLNADSVNLLTALNSAGALKRQLNYLMGNQINTDINLDREVTFFTDFVFDEVLTRAKLNSTLLVMAGIQENIANIDQKLATANLYPKILLNSSYGLNSSRNGAGIVLEQSNVGFAGGISISVPIFSGGRTKIAMDNAAIEMEKSQVVKRQNEGLVEKEVNDYWSNYKLYETVLKKETANVETAQLSLDRANDQLKLGQITSVEYRQIQLSLLSSKNRINAAKYNLKKAEYQLLRLNGTLVK